jgi:hypothetical protein
MMPCKETARAMLTPEQQAQYNALLLKQYKGTLTAEEQAELEALQLLRNAPDTAPTPTDMTNLPPNLVRFAGEVDLLEADMADMSGKIGGRSALAEAKTSLGATATDAARKPEDDAAH